MPVRNLPLEEKVYEGLQKAAESEGVTPGEWIHARLPVTSERQPNRNDLARYIGTFDSSNTRSDSRYQTEYGDIVAEKLRRQGLNIP
jgi:hypothetical protein